MVYYASNGSVGSCLTLGTNLSITTGVINAASGGSPAFSAITGATNTTAAMLVGTGASLGVTGSGTIAATTAANLSGTPALPNGTTATTQTLADNTTKIATDAFVLANAGGSATSITPGTTTVVGATAPCLISNSTSTTMGCAATNATVLADIAANTTFTVAGTGCTPSAHTGGPFAGTVTLASGPCTSITITFNGATGFTAPNGYHCNVGDRTLQAAGTWWGEWPEHSSTTTTAVLDIPGASGATDVISFDCQYF